MYVCLNASDLVAQGAWWSLTAATMPAIGSVTSRPEYPRTALVFGDGPLPANGSASRRCAGLDVPCDWRHNCPKVELSSESRFDGRVGSADVLELGGVPHEPRGH